METVKLDFCIPDTVVFHNTPAAWFFYDVKESAVRRHPAGNLEKSCIKEFFLRPTESDIICTFLDMEKASTSGCVMQFMDRKETETFLTDGVTHTGLLQRFVVPKCTNNQVFQAVWAPQMFWVQKRTNRKKMLDRLCDRNTKGITWEGPTYYAEDFDCSAKLERRLKSACQSFVDFFSSVDHHYLISRMVLYFKEDPKEKIWLMYSSSIRIQEKGYDPLLSRVETLSLTPDFMGLSFEDEDERERNEKRRRKLLRDGATSPTGSTISANARSPGSVESKLLKAPFTPLSLPLPQQRPKTALGSMEHIHSSFASSPSKMKNTSASLFRNNNNNTPLYARPVRCPSHLKIEDVRKQIDAFRLENDKLEQKLTVVRNARIQKLREIQDPKSAMNTQKPTTPTTGGDDHQPASQTPSAEGNTGGSLNETMENATEIPQPAFASAGGPVNSAGGQPLITANMIVKEFVRIGSRSASILGKLRRGSNHNSFSSSTGGGSGQALKSHNSFSSSTGGGSGQALK
eukprot:PhF_6_TR11702/c0_g1_i1/m.19024